MIVLLNILIVVALFNVIIFVHELGHFLAAKWRGLRIDRFQIWFGKPLWKKEINGVQYGLGWLPAGGFVALPQMAPMEAVEGKNREPGEQGEQGELEEPLPPVKPLDKIIVAFAGPLFSFLLALFFGPDRDGRGQAQGHRGEHGDRLCGGGRGGPRQAAGGR
jgi:regulator of sigma E protease